MAESLWEVLRQTGLTSLAPVLVKHGVLTIPQIKTEASNLLAHGLQQWQLESIITFRTEETQVTPDIPGRPDFPVRYSGKRANIAQAMEAGHPNNRKRSLAQLDADVLARSSNPSQDARLRTYMCLCNIWEVRAFPLDFDNVRAFAASLKAGGYRSASVYFQTICSHQQRHLRTTVSPAVRHCIRDCIRSIKRGLGVSQLKDGFNALLLANVPISEDADSFDMSRVAHSRDMVVVALWYMLREVEISAALAHHLQIHHDHINLLIPTYKTDSFGKLTERSLRCSCRVRLHPLCPWHAGERHLIRLQARLDEGNRQHSYLFPQPDGSAATKPQVVAAIRMVLQSAGIQLQRPDGTGNMKDRFHGHCLRVSGAQMLAAAGVQVQLIQLLGRWTSISVQRYTQDAALVITPDLPLVVLNNNREASDTSALPAATTSAPRPPMGVNPSTQGANAASSEVKIRLDDMDQRYTASLERMKRQLASLQESVAKPQQAFVKRIRSCIVHVGSMHELTNQPRQWKSRCGWQYGTANFLRVTDIVAPLRKCRKCFDLGDRSDSDGSSTSSSVISDDTSSDGE